MNIENIDKLIELNRQLKIVEEYLKLDELGKQKDIVLGYYGQVFEKPLTNDLYPELQEGIMQLLRQEKHRIIKAIEEL